MTHVCGITVSVDFADYLALTLPHNKPQLDDYWIVTADDDRDTIAVCEDHSVNCLPVPRTNPFLKGVYYNHCFAHLDKPDWLLLLDADVVLPNSFNEIVHSYPLDPRYLYGVPQRYCYDHRQWQRFVERGTEYPWRRSTRFAWVPFRFFTVRDLAGTGFSTSVTVTTLARGRTGFSRC